MFKKGLCSVSFRNSTAEEIFSEAKKSDISLIEWGSDVHAPCTDVQKLQNIAGLGEKYGIGTSSYGTYFRLGSDGVEKLAPYIEAARILGTDMLRIWVGTKGSAEYNGKTI